MFENCFREVDMYEDTGHNQSGAMRMPGPGWGWLRTPLWKSFPKQSALNGGEGTQGSKKQTFQGENGLQKGFLEARKGCVRNMKPFGSTLRKLPDVGLKSITKLHIMRKKLQGRGDGRARETLSFAKIKK